MSEHRRLSTESLQKKRELAEGGKEPMQEGKNLSGTTESVQGERLRGKIIKSLAGFYEVHTGDAVYRCRARGIFRALGQKPLVGDDVEIEVTDVVSDPMEGNVTALFPRKNELVRPYVANVDQALLLFAITQPAPSYNMLDRFLISVSQRDLKAILCFNKQDLATEKEIGALREAYEACGCRLLFISTKDTESLKPLWEVLCGRTTVLTGPSGVGKSTLINVFCPGARMETGELSRKISRGKNTTRHVEILAAEGETYLVDTPGFTSLWLMDLQAEDLRAYYPEFEKYAGKCKFGAGCAHMSEPDCAVRDAVERGEISRIRYQNYQEIYRELRERKPEYKSSKQRV